MCSPIRPTAKAYRKRVCQQCRNEWAEQQITVHGFRSIFRDYIAEKTDSDGAIAEHSPAHKINNKAVAAYQRGALMDKRRLMMQRYANYAYQTGEKVVQLRV